MTTTIASTALLQALRQEDNSAAWRQFCDRYEPLLLAFTRRAGLGEEDARDVVQETLAAFVQGFRAGRYDPDRGRLRSWLQGIAFNKIREARRRFARPEVQVVDPGDGTRFMNRVPDDEELTDLFEQEWERAVLAECLREVRRHFDPQTLRAFKLYVLESRPAEDVARELGISRNAVYVGKSRVMAHLTELQKEIAARW